MRYAVVIEKAEGNYSAYVPDLPGCVATGLPWLKSKPKTAMQSSFMWRACVKTDYPFRRHQAGLNTLTSQHDAQPDVAADRLRRPLK